MRFIVSDKPDTYRKDDTIWTYDHWIVSVITDYGTPRTVAIFIGSDRIGEISKEIAPLLAGDYCDFLNDKYHDKEFNKEWDQIYPEESIKYHEEQLENLKKGRPERVKYHKEQIKILTMGRPYSRNRHGNKIERP